MHCHACLQPFSYQLACIVIPTTICLVSPSCMYCHPLLHSFLACSMHCHSSCSIHYKYMPQAESDKRGRLDRTSLKQVLHSAQKVKQHGKLATGHQATPLACRRHIVQKCAAKHVTSDSCCFVDSCWLLLLLIILVHACRLVGYPYPCHTG